MFQHDDAAPDSVAVLQANLGALSAKDQAFASSMLDQYAERGFLSDKQLHWVGVLADRAQAKAAPAPVAVALGNVAGVLALFTKSRKPIKLQLPDGSPIALSVAGAAARCPGTVNVTDGQPYGQNVWYGRVDPVQGQWQPSKQGDAATQTAVAALLVHLSADPAAVAAAYGQLTGSCCFCGLTLTDPRSKHVGYGPICAGNRGLPWGDK
jgi:hypothetical protein